MGTRLQNQQTRSPTSLNGRTLGFRHRRGWAATALVLLSKLAIATPPARTPSPIDAPAATGAAVNSPTKTRTSDPYRGLWDQDSSFLFVRPEFTWGRDPFLKRPGFGPNDFIEPKWELSAVFYDGLQSEALINGTRVRVGEEVGGRVVEEIGPNYVLLTRNDSVLELNLPTNTDGGSSIRLEEVDGPDSSTRGKR